MAIQSRVFPGPLSKLISIGSPEVYSDFETLITGPTGSIFLMTSIATVAMLESTSPSLAL